MSDANLQIQSSRKNEVRKQGDLGFGTREQGVYFFQGSSIFNPRVSGEAGRFEFCARIKLLFVSDLALVIN